MRKLALNGNADHGRTVILPYHPDMVLNQFLTIVSDSDPSEDQPRFRGYIADFERDSHSNIQWALATIYPTIDSFSDAGYDAVLSIADSGGRVIVGPLDYHFDTYRDFHNPTYIDPATLQDINLCATGSHTKEINCSRRFSMTDGVPLRAAAHTKSLVNHEIGVSAWQQPDDDAGNAVLKLQFTYPLAAGPVPKMAVSIPTIMTIITDYSEDNTVDIVDAIEVTFNP